MTTKQDRIEVRRNVYGTDDLGTLSIFGGGFINFGYWRDIAIDGVVTLEQRVASQQAMYDLVVDALQIGAEIAYWKSAAGAGSAHLPCCSAIRHGYAASI
jgi:MPBQ/MSBQ methyltransferase